MLKTVNGVFGVLTKATTVDVSRELAEWLINSNRAKKLPKKKAEETE